MNKSDCYFQVLVFLGVFSVTWIVLYLKDTIPEYLRHRKAWRKIK